MLHNCEDLFHLYSLSAVHSYDLYHMHLTLLLLLYCIIIIIIIIIIIMNDFTWCSFVWSRIAKLVKWLQEQLLPTTLQPLLDHEPLNFVLE